MKSIAMLLLVSASVCSAQMGGFGSSNFSACSPMVRNFGPQIFFDQLGHTKVDVSNTQIISSSRKGDIESIDYWASGPAMNTTNEVVLKRTKANLKISRKDDRPFLATTTIKNGDETNIRSRQFEYSTTGRCRTAKQFAIQMKAGKVESAIIDQDADLCDKIVDQANKDLYSARALNMCAGAIGSLSKIFNDHAKSLKGLDIQIAGSKKSVKVDAKIGNFSYRTGKVVPIDINSTEALLHKVAECHYNGGIMREKPLYGSNNFKRKKQPAAVPQPPVAVPAVVDSAPAGGQANLTPEAEVVVGTN